MGASCAHIKEISMNKNLVSRDPVFSAMASEAKRELDLQKKKWWYVYNLSGFIPGQTQKIFEIITDQNTDFHCQFLSISAYSYSSSANERTLFPIPNPFLTTPINYQAFAGRGLAVRISDTRAGRELTSGFVPLELIACPGWDNSSDRPFPFRYMFYRNTLIRIEIRNFDNVLRTMPSANSVNPGSSQQFEFALSGYKIAGGDQ